MCRGGSLELDQKAGEVDQESEMPALRKLLLHAARANQEAVDTLTTTCCFFALISVYTAKKSCIVPSGRLLSAASHTNKLVHSPEAEALRKSDAAPSGRPHRVPCIGDVGRRASLCEGRSFL